MDNGCGAAMFKRNVSRRQLVLLFFWTVVYLPTAGCGGLQQAELSGEVTYDGTPVESGFMRFFPVQGTPGDGASANIEDGKYSLAADDGLVAGAYRVSIMASRETGRKIKVPEPTPDAPSHVMETFQYLPEKFNSRTELQVTLKPGSNKEDFVLSSK